MVGGHATVGRLSNNVFWTFQAIREIFWKSRWTVTRQWSEVTRPSTDCQTTFLDVSSDLGNILKKSRWTVTRQWLRSRDRRPTVKQRFLDVSSNLGKFWKKVAERSRDSGRGHATVGRLSNNVFWTFQAIRNKFEKSRWTVTRQWSEVTRPSADCQTTLFGRFKRFGKILKKVAERSRDSGWGHATVPSTDCQTTFFGRFKRFGKIFLKIVAERSRDSCRRSRDRPTVKQRFFWTFQAIWENFEKKSLNGHVTVVGGHATVGRLSNNVFWTFQAIWENFEKSRWTVTRQWLRSRDRRPTVKQRFLDVSSDLGKFWKKSLNGHATVVGGHATVGRLSNNVFSTFQAIRNFFEKSRWTVTWQWLEVTRPSADCQTTFFGRFKRFGKILKKSRWTVTRQWSRSRDRRPTVKQRFLDVSSDLGKFWKKSLNGHATVVGGHATVGRLSNNVFWTFQAIWENFEKSRWTVTRQWLRSRDRRPTVKQRFLDVSSDLGKFWKKSLNGHATVVEVTRPSADCQTTFLDVSSN